MVDEFDVVLRAAQAGDEAAVGALWDRLHHRLVRFLWARAGDAAEDIASETWLAVARGLRGFEGGETEFRAWLFTIARRRLVDWRRRAIARPQTVRSAEALEAAVAADDPARDALENLDTQAALALIARLPDDQAEVLLLRVLAGLDVDRVAEMMGKRPGNVRVLQHRGLARLRRLTESRDPSERGVTQ